jgi:hypothetical protein
LANDDRSIPDMVKAWEEEEYLGLGLARWLATKANVDCPILILSVVQDPLTTYHLDSCNLKYSLCKSGLLPSVVKNEIFSIWGVEDE